MELHNGQKTFHAKTRNEWRRWLRDNHDREKSVWLIIYHKRSTTKSVYYDEAVEEALCFGWIDSKPNKRDHESYYQFFARRNPKSNWSKINKARAADLIKRKLMRKPGLEMIELAKKTGTWNALNQVSAVRVPPDLKTLLEKNKTAYKHWKNFPPSSRKGILEWILQAKTPGTREKRIQETVKLAAANIKANHYRQ